MLVSEFMVSLVALIAWLILITCSLLAALSNMARWCSDLEEK
jgi:hypothetical protein